MTFPSTRKDRLLYLMANAPKTSGWFVSESIQLFYDQHPEIDENIHSLTHRKLLEDIEIKWPLHWAIKQLEEWEKYVNIAP